MGVTEGTPVTWELPTRIETIVLSFALSRLGAVQNPIIHIYRHREVGYCIGQTGAELVVHPGVWGGFDYGAMIEEVTAGLDRPPLALVGYDTLPEADPSMLPPPPDPRADGVRWLYYTSGTTSDPKGVRHTDRSLIAGGIGLARALDMTGDDIGSIAFPYSHIGGPDYMVTMLSSGFGAVLVERFDPAAATAAYARHGVTMGRRVDGLLPDVPRRGPQVPRRRTRPGHARPAGAVGRRRPQATRDLLPSQRADGSARGPRLRHDRVSDDLAGIAP